MTKREHFEQILANYTLSADDAAFVQHEIELLDSKSANKKPSVKQSANLEIKDAIYAEMEAEKLYSITDMMKQLPSCADLSNQRTTALVKQMMPERIERVEVKRRAFFKKVC